MLEFVLGLMLGLTLGQSIAIINDYLVIKKVKKHLRRKDHV